MYDPIKFLEYSDKKLRLIIKQIMGEIYNKEFALYILSNWHLPKTYEGEC